MQLARSRHIPLCLPLVFLTAATLAAQHEESGIPVPANGNALRHVEADVLPFNLDLRRRGPDGALIRNNSVFGNFEVPVRVFEDFESGALDPARWTTSSSDPGGRIRVDGVMGSADGDRALVMDRSPAGTYTLNEAILTLDLASAPSRILAFSERESGDELHALPSGVYTGSVPGDGVSISVDGHSWYPVFQGGSSSYSWTQRTVDLDAAAVAAGFTLGSTLLVKFQQYDNFPVYSDGLAFDAIGFQLTGIDADDFVFELDPGQKLEIRLAPSAGVVGGISVMRGNTPVAQAVGNAAGDPVLIQTASSFGRLSGRGVGTETYTIRVANMNAVQGSYELFVSLNEINELEPVNGSTNDDPTDAEPLDAAFLPLNQSVKSAGVGIVPARAGIRGRGGRKEMYRESFEDPLGSEWELTSSTSTGRIRRAETYTGSDLALVMDNDPVDVPSFATFYEQFYSSFFDYDIDLSHRALRLTPNASGGYDVGPSAATFATAVNDVGAGYRTTHDRALGFSIDWPGAGQVTDITIDSNGRIAPVGTITSSSYPSTSAFFNTPQLCALWKDLRPDIAGSVYFDATPGKAVVTWQGVHSYTYWWWYYSRTNTFQIQIHDTGAIDLVWLGCGGGSIVGFSDGPGAGNAGELLTQSNLSSALYTPFSTARQNVQNGIPSNLNEAILHLDLSAASNPELRFYMQSFSDENTPFQGPFQGSYPADGVAISSNGSDWFPVRNLYWSGSYYIDLAYEANRWNVPLDENFRIKFQQVDGLAIPRDGRALDDVRILVDDNDYYEVSLTRGESIAVYGTGFGGLEVALEDAAGNQLVESTTQPIRNGGFETSSFGWQSTSTASGPGSGPNRYGGFITNTQDYFRPIAGNVLWGNLFRSEATPSRPQGPYEFALSQVFTLPTRVPGPLRWYERLQWDFTVGPNLATLPRSHRVELRDPDTGNVLALLHEFETGTRQTDPTGDTGWVLKRADLSAWAGQTVEIVFRQIIPEPDTGAGVFVLDGVTIEGITEGVDAFAPHFVAPRTGTYYVRAAGSSAYDLLVLRNAEFGLEPNDSIGDAQPVGSTHSNGGHWVVGHAERLTVDPDYFEVQGTAGESLEFELYVPGGGTGSLDNAFAPELRLLDSQGAVLAQAVPEPETPGLIQLSHPVSADGRYYVCVSARADVFASEDFESGALDSSWTVSSSTADGFSEPSTFQATRPGRYSLIQSKRTDDLVDNLNEAVWSVDLTGATSPLLRFSHQSINDERDYRDGVFVSDNGGASFQKIFSGRTGNTAWRDYEISLGNWRNYGPGFLIKFSQDDNYSLPTDGLAWDNISVVSQQPEGSYVLVIRGDR